MRVAVGYASRYKCASKHRADWLACRPAPSGKPDGDEAAVLVKPHLGLRKQWVVWPPGVLAFKLRAPAQDDLGRTGHDAVEVRPKRFRGLGADGSGVVIHVTFAAVDVNEPK